jgi:hypothetical protein
MPGLIVSFVSERSAPAFHTFVVRSDMSPNMTTNERMELRVATLLSRDQSHCTTKRMQGGRQRGEDGMVVVRGREVFDVLQNGGTEGTEVLGAHTC